MSTTLCLLSQGGDVSPEGTQGMSSMNFQLTINCVGCGRALRIVVNVASDALDRLS